jgi:hypothetical protein
MNPARHGSRAGRRLTESVQGHHGAVPNAAVIPLFVALAVFGLVLGAAIAALG